MSALTGHAIETVNLSKQFRLHKSLFSHVNNDSDQTTAVDNVNLSIREGELFGLMGPNGAGKTTLTKILCTLILPSSGNAYVNGYDVTKDEEKVKHSISLVIAEDRSFFQRLTCRENLRFFASLYNLRSNEAKAKIKSLSDILALDEFLDKRFDNCSTGMKQRLAIARGLLIDPKILFFDEPTKSLDPTAAYGLRRLVRNIADNGYTIVFITHRIDEAKEICDRVGVMKKGRLEIVTTLNHLGQYFEQSKVSSPIPINDQHATILRKSSSFY